ncbi:hypothetical protein C0991_007449 [Blastosporella zonata]|nr:hypothetical protein C0991_007449 [Blastosporella zonata]
MIIGKSPIKSVSTTRKFLEENGWVLAGDPYDREKLARIIATVAVGDALFKSSPIGSRTQAKNALLAVAFLLKSDITDHVSNTLADAVATKALARLKTTAANLAASAAFASAHDTARAESTIAMQKITDKLSTLVDAMENSAPWALPQQLNLPTTAPPQPQPS